MSPTLPKVMISPGFNISSCSFLFGLSFLFFFQAALVSVFGACLFYPSELIDVLISSALAKQKTIMFFALGFSEILCLRSLFQIFFFHEQKSFQTRYEVNSGHIHRAKNRSLPVLFLHFFLTTCLTDMLGGKACPQQSLVGGCWAQALLLWLFKNKNKMSSAGMITSPESRIMLLIYMYYQCLMTWNN